MTALYIITIVIIILSILLGIVILIQKPKGGGLSATFGGVGNQIFGAQNSSDFITKSTWVLAVLMLALSLFSSAFLPNTTQENIEVIETTRTEQQALEDDGQEILEQDEIIEIDEK